MVRNERVQQAEAGVPRTADGYTIDELETLDKKKLKKAREAFNAAMKPSSSKSSEPGKKSKKKSGAQDRRTTRDDFSADTGFRTIAETVDRHEVYHKAVQLPEEDVRNLQTFYKRAHEEVSRMGRRRVKKSGGEDDDDLGERVQATLLREDFCGTAIVCREWSKLSPENIAYGVDLDAAVLDYADKVTRGTKGGTESERVKLYWGDVLVDQHKPVAPSDQNVRIVEDDDTPTADKRGSLGALPKVDIIAGLNYGVCYFGDRTTLVKYLRASRSRLRDGGVLVVDVFGGGNVTSGKGRIVERRFEDFTYYFEQRGYDVYTNCCEIHLHFRFPKDGSWLRSVFRYTFRAYTIPEIREAMIEAGFSETMVWWAPSGSSVDEDDDEEDEYDVDEEGDDCGSDKKSEAGDEEGSDEERTRERTRESDEQDGVGIHEYTLVTDRHIPQVPSWNAYIVGIL
ncbi:hypothetical protein BJ742DRAFT_815243 [Cladochytrium replicatum]|nr:hypothetical protein BJ742DRAFT_815243 [Cladochytrium replicatum]